MENLEEAPVAEEKINLIVTEEMRSYIYEMAKWASFLAIVGFVFTGITIIFALTVGAATDTSPEMANMLGQLGAGGQVAITILFLVLAFIIFYPSLLLFKYANKAKYGVLYGEQASLNEAFAKLKSLFKFWALITILYLGLNILVFIAKVMTGVAAG